MKRVTRLGTLLLLLCLGVGGVFAQGSGPEVGDPPVASRISVSAPDENGIVTITGDPGAVFPAADVAVRNLYTEAVVYTQAGITGAFSARIYGPGNTPFWISPTQSIPLDLRNRPGSLPGGPGTIIAGNLPESRITLEVPVTRLLVDGRVDEWGTYGQAALGSNLFALANQESIYVATTDVPANYDQVRVQFGVNDIEFAVTLDPRLSATAIWQEIADPAPRDLGALAVYGAANVGVELRIPLAPLQQRLFGAAVDRITLSQIAFLDPDGSVVASSGFSTVNIVRVDEQDGIVYLDSPLEEPIRRFTVSGAVAQGAAPWHARVRVSTLDLNPGDDLLLEMDVTLNAPDFGDTFAGLAMIGRFTLQPVLNGDGMPVSGGLHVRNGWSTLTTPSGLAIDNVPGDVFLGEVLVPPAQVIRKNGQLVFGISGRLPLPADLPAGLYVLAFEGLAQTGDGVPFRWSDNGLLGEGDGISPVPLTRTPAVLRVGLADDTPLRLPWVLLMDQPSDGSRGIIAQEDAGHFALSNRVHFNAPTYIVPPSSDDDALPLEPYLINMMPNDYNSTAAPLLPLLFPSGRLNGLITLPDGATESLSSAPVLQAALSTVALDERDRFGEQSQVDVYRLTTLNDIFSQVTLTQYGDYTVELNGFVEDVWGNRYEGGGTYTFTVAQPLDIRSAVLPGTPFEPGDAFNAGLHVSPGVNATVSVRVQVFPLDGSAPTEQMFEGRTNSFGVFQPETSFVFDAPGEYVIDYEARYTDNEGRLWAGSLRGAGVIGSADGSSVIAHGVRGVANLNPGYDPAWFSAEQYTGVDAAAVALYAPYNRGDVAWVEDAPTTGIWPIIRLQDEAGLYAGWLTETHPSLDGQPMARRAVEGELPAVMLGEDPAASALLPLHPDELVNAAYTYTSIIRPGVTMRQAVLGRDSRDFPLIWSPDDPANEQIGAGAAGTRPGDYLFLFGGAVVRNEAADVREAVIYGAGAMIIDDDDERGSRVFPPYRGADGGPDGGPLLVLNDEPVGLFFQPTASRPGDVLVAGEVLSVAGQVMPTLPAAVQVVVTSPSGMVRRYTGEANAIGHFYQPQFDFVVEETGIWTVDVTVLPSPTSSAGQVEPPVSSGGVLGAQSSGYSVVVLPEGNAKLLWEQAADQPISAGFPYNFTFSFPPDWTDVQSYLTVTIPGVILQDGPVPPQGGSLRYQYNPTQINQLYPFFEGNDGRVNGAASSDPLTLTFVLTGLDADGVPQIQARQVVIRHDRLLTID